VLLTLYQTCASMGIIGQSGRVRDADRSVHHQVMNGKRRSFGIAARRFFLGTWNMKGFLSEERPIRTLREVLQRLREAYCGTIGYEVLPHFTSWLQSLPLGKSSIMECLPYLWQCKSDAPSFVRSEGG
jgi:hypothetical protein